MRTDTIDHKGLTWMLLEVVVLEVVVGETKPEPTPKAMVRINAHAQLSRRNENAQAAIMVSLVASGRPTVAFSNKVGLCHERTLPENVWKKISSTCKGRYAVSRMDCLYGQNQVGQFSHILWLELVVVYDQ